MVIEYPPAMVAFPRDEFFIQEYPDIRIESLFPPEGDKGRNKKNSVDGDETGRNVIPETNRVKGSDLVDPDVEEYVHIIPLGYEVDRAVIPFQQFRAHRVYLLTIMDGPKYSTPELQEKNRAQRHFENRVKEALESQGIKVIPLRVDMFDILEVMHHVSRIIIAEKERGNRVYVNMAAAGRLTSVGATLAAMAHGVRIYYVRADAYSSDPTEIQEHGLSICREAKITSLENFQFQLPDELSTRILVQACAAGGHGLSADDILSGFVSDKVPGFEQDFRSMGHYDKRRVQSNYLMKLNKGYLTKLEQAGYITKNKVGRNSVIQVTDSGRYMAYVSGRVVG